MSGNYLRYVVKLRRRMAPSSEEGIVASCFGNLAEEVGFELLEI